MKRITIDPITRLEGHGKIEIFLNEEGDVVRMARRTDVAAQPVSAAVREAYVRNAVRKAVMRGAAEGPAKAGAESLLHVLPAGRRAGPYDRMLTDAVSGRVWSATIS